MRHPRILSGQEAALLVIDVQESFRKVLPDVANLTRNISILVEASKLLAVPVLVTEQYPHGLGRTMAEIAACLGEHRLFEKLHFSCCQAEGFTDAIKGSGRRQIIACGIEAHVCVSQTVHDLIQQGFTVHIVTDAISSRLPRNKEIGIEKMVGSGAVPSSVEMALFEMLGQSGTETFRTVQRLIK